MKAQLQIGELGRKKIYTTTSISVTPLQWSALLMREEKNLTFGSGQPSTNHFQGYYQRSRS